MKLSKTQVEMLKRLGAGEVLVKRWDGAGSWLYWRDADRYAVIRGATISKLLRLGFTREEFAKDQSCVLYAITDQGRDYLAELEATP